MSIFDSNKTYGIFDSPLNKKRISELERENIETILFPTITTNEIEIDNAIAQDLIQIDWLIFTDVYTVEYFVSSLEKLGVDLFDLDHLRVLAYGEAVADRLRFSQLHTDVIPSSIKPSDVFEALKNYVLDETGFEYVSFFILSEQNLYPTEFSNYLEDLDSFVSGVAVYSIEIADETAIPKLKALLKGGAIDEFIFSSHYDVLNLAQLFQTENLSELLEGIKITATDNLTLQSLQEFRLIEK